jgi:hypothetical protein
MNLKGQDRLGELRKNRRIILKWIIENCGVKVLTEFKWLRKESSGRFL